MRTDVRAYLYGVARRLLMQEWKRRRVRGEVITPSQAELQARGRTPSSALQRADAWELLSDALSGLPLEFSAVLERFFLEEQSIATIAEELGVAKGTVKSRLHRGKAMLRKQLTALEVKDPLRQSSLEIVAARDDPDGSGS
ncbi:MAG: sigma-70 family RNA polymerase sigma factor [Nannocystaceae bacterium]|nr:sigma-70 family RNA polymerase sigma factor [Nannocystaceae bacterium]